MRLKTDTLPPQPFSRRLREETRQAHTLAENTAFVRGFLRGVIDARNYLQLLSDLHLVYEVMEQALDRHTPTCPAIAAIWLPELRRLPSLEADLRYFCSLIRTERPTPSAAARRYARRIEDVAATHPELLVAHAYTRYLGDLSGGQVLKTLLHRSLRIPPGQGSAFYDFNQITNPTETKQRFRARLDELAAHDPELQQAIINEANHVFALNLAVFRSLEGRSLHVMLRLLLSAFQPAPAPVAQT